MKPLEAYFFTTDDGWVPSGFSLILENLISNAECTTFHHSAADSHSWKYTIKLKFIKTDLQKVCEHGRLFGLVNVSKHIPHSPSLLVSDVAPFGSAWKSPGKAPESEIKLQNLHSH